VDANKILDEMATANNGLNIVMLDACRDNPYARNFRNATRGLAIVSSAPSGTFISYSTSPGNVARDGDGRNSPYTAALLQFIQAPGQTISDVFINVRTKVKRETGQVPWELSSLEGQFYFMPGSVSTSAATVPAGKTMGVRDESSVSTTAVTDNLDDENRKLAAEQRHIEEERASFAKKKALEEKRRKIAEEREGLAAEQEAERRAASVPIANVIRRDGRFIAINNGTVLDTKSNLMWAAKDNGSDINWANAKSYCESYRGGGYTDWRMPTQDELTGLYDSAVKGKNDYNLTNFIELTGCCPWASETRGSEAAIFGFVYGKRSWTHQSKGFIFYRVLPVRSNK
jgi:hypothetical protein